MISNPPPKSRDLGLDTLKAVATLLVIVGHVIQFTNPNFDNSPFFKIIYAFHMPLFMCISGYLMPRAIGPGFLQGKFLQLVIPFLLWSIIVILIRNLGAGTENSGAIFAAELLQALIAPDNGLWFLWVLFLNCVAFTLLEGRHRLKLSFALIIALYALQFISSEFSNFGLNLFRWHYAFFLLGFMLRKTQIAIVIKKYLWPIAIVTILALMHWDRNLVTTFFGLAINSNAASKILTLAVKYVAAIGVLFILFHFKDKLQYRSSVASFFANQSLGYYGTQTVFLIPATLIWNSQTVSHQVIVFLFTVITCSLVILVFDRIGIMRRFLLGKRP